MIPVIYAVREENTVETSRLIEKLYINISRLEGKRFEDGDKDAFINRIYAGTDIIPPATGCIISNKEVLPWRVLRMGDVAVFSKDNSFIAGLVVGEIERQICFVDPETSLVRLAELDGSVIGYDYVNGFKVIIDE